MSRKRRYKTRKPKKGGRGIPYIYKYRIYFWKKPKAGNGAVSRVIACLLESVGDAIGV